MTLGAAHPARGGIGKVGRIEHGIVTRALLEQSLSRGAGARRILVGHECEIGTDELDRVMEDVAREQ
jgi:hypothetical protein